MGKRGLGVVFVTEDNKKYISYESQAEASRRLGCTREWIRQRINTNKPVLGKYYVYTKKMLDSIMRQD